MILLDLFSGVGGFHIGLEMAGYHFDQVYFSEVDEYAIKVYQKRFPAAIPLGDITKIDPSELPKIDIVCGGFPCQDISVAGNQKGLEHEGEQTRSGLFFEIIRICDIIRPKILFLENVRNLLSIDDGKAMQTVLSEINRINYNCQWEVIAASDVGAPHRRQRTWIVCWEKQNAKK